MRVRERVSYLVNARLTLHPMGMLCETRTLVPTMPDRSSILELRSNMWPGMSVGTTNSWKQLR